MKDLTQLLSLFIAMIPPTTAVVGGLWLVYEAIRITENDNMIWAVVLVAVLAVGVYPHRLGIR